MGLFIHSVSHLLVDALCAATLFGALSGGGDLSVLLLVYNTLAFSTQCVVGLIADKLGRHSIAACASMLLVLLGFLLPASDLLRVFLIGVGNSVFHVAGGTMTLLSSEGKAGKLGVFVAPGAIGLTVGTLYPQVGWVVAVLTALFAFGCLWAGEERKPVPVSIAPDRGQGVLLAALLACAVAVRAVGGSAVSFPWKTTGALSLLMTFFVFLGKSGGGLLCDRFGAKRAALVSVPLAALLIAFCSGWMLPSLLGQFALNLTMPITLYLMYRAMPDAPGFAFGLAAAALWPGTILGRFITLTGPAAWVFVIVCFIFGLWAILYAVKKIDIEQ